MNGTITKLDALEIGKLANYLGAGRLKKEDTIDPRVGFVFNKKVGEKVSEGDVIGYIHADDEEKLKHVKNKVKDFLEIV